VKNAMYRQAYLVFSSKQEVDEAIKKFKRERTRLDDRRLILIRWNPKHVLPTGILTPCLMFFCGWCVSVGHNMLNLFCRMMDIY